MYALITRRKIAAGSAYGPHLLQVRRGHSHLRAYRVAIALVANELQNQPVVLRGCLIMQYMDRPVVGNHHRVQTTIVIQVADSQSPSNPWLLERSSGSGGDVCESCAGIAREQHWFAIMGARQELLYRFGKMTLGNEQIFPAVVVEVKQARSPSGM